MQTMSVTFPLYDTLSHETSTPAPDTVAAALTLLDPRQAECALAIMVHYFETRGTTFNHRAPPFDVKRGKQGRGIVFCITSLPDECIYLLGRFCGL